MDVTGTAPVELQRNSHLPPVISTQGLCSINPLRLRTEVLLAALFLHNRYPVIGPTEHPRCCYLYQEELRTPRASHLPDFPIHYCAYVGENSLSVL